MAHRCHATGCNTPVKPEMWGCKKHWFMVPKPIRDRIWATYRAGQCDDQSPSRAYCEAARDAVVSVAKKEGIKPDIRLYDSYLHDEPEPDDQPFDPCHGPVDLDFLEKHGNPHAQMRAKQLRIAIDKALRAKHLKPKL